MILDCPVRISRHEEAMAYAYRFSDAQHREINQRDHDLEEAIEQAEAEIEEGPPTQPDVTLNEPVTQTVTRTKHAGGRPRGALPPMTPAERQRRHREKALP